MRKRTLLVLALGAVTIACESSPSVRRAEASVPDSLARARTVEAERARQDSIVRARPGYVVDSILPIEEEIRRFQATIVDRPRGFENGAPSRAALITAFVRALERRDTAALARMVVDRAEFGYLVYPTSPNAHPPYRQPPEIVWLARSASTDKGLGQLVTRFGGRPLQVSRVACPDSADRQGANTLWSGCTVTRVVETGDTVRLRMFGSIIERDGRFKFLSLANGL